MGFKMTPKAGFLFGAALAIIVVLVFFRSCDLTAPAHIDAGVGELVN